MQKKLIALAIAGLASGAAFAQSNVTIYGTVDLAVTHGTDHTTDGVGSNTGIDDGGWDSSRFGWRGVEDLGNGLSVAFEQQVRSKADIRTSSGDYGQGWSTNKSYLALQSKSWGMIKAGTDSDVHDDIIGFSEAGGMSWGKGVVDMVIDDATYNSLQYVSPTFGGLKFRIGGSTNDQNDGETENDYNIQSVGGNVTYLNGPIKFGVALESKSQDDNAGGVGTDGDFDAWTVSGGYDFGVVKLGAAYAEEENDGLGDANFMINGSNDYTKKIWRVNLGAPIGANNHVNLSYTDAEVDYNGALSDGDAKGYGLSFIHTMSKRTDLYAAYAKIDQDDDDTMLYEGYESRFKVGIRHRF